MSASLLSSLRSRGWIDTPRAASPIGFPFGLGACGVHEVAEAAYGDAAAATGFALGALERMPERVVWVREARRGAEHGRVPGGALKAQRLEVSARRNDEALWTIEEAIASGVAALIIGEVSAADFTASRRLALAAGRHGVGVILLLPWQTEGASAASVRWRVASAPSAPNRFDARAPGPPRWRVTLERCRPAPGLIGAVYDVESRDETISVSVVPALAAGAARKSAATRAAG